jgi:hypothetical protein
MTLMSQPSWNYHTKCRKYCRLDSVKYIRVICQIALPIIFLGVAATEARPVREGVSTDSLEFSGPAMPNPYTPCGQATPQTALRLFGGWPTRKAVGLRPSSSPLDTPSRTALTEAIEQHLPKTTAGRDPKQHRSVKLQRSNFREEKPSSYLMKVSTYRQLYKMEI